MTNSDNDQDKEAVQFPTADHNPGNVGTPDSIQDGGSATARNASALGGKGVKQESAPNPTKENTAQSQDVPEEDTLDDAIEETFPASDPVSVTTKKPDDTQS